MKRLLIATILLVLPLLPAQAENETRECVVLLHGLARTEKSLAKLEKHLEAGGFAVENVGYPSREKTIQELSLDVIPEAIGMCLAQDASKVHFVTHSMGGILVRYYLEHTEVPKLGRVVMLSPPNSGSEVVDKLKDSRIFQWINGPAGAQLGTDEASVPRSLGVPSYEVGIITGDQSINPILSLLIPGTDDGKVSVENAKLQGMKDFLIVHKTHPFIMNDEGVLRQVTTFLRKGMFDRDEQGGP